MVSNRNLWSEPHDTIMFCYYKLGKMYIITFSSTYYTMEIALEICPLGTEFRRGGIVVVEVHRYKYRSIRCVMINDQFTAICYPLMEYDPHIIITISDNDKFQIDYQFKCDDPLKKNVGCTIRNTKNIIIDYEKMKNILSFFRIASLEQKRYPSYSNS